MLLSARGKVKGGNGTGGGEGNRLTVTAGSDKERGRVAGRRVAVVVIVVELFYVQKPFNEKGEYVGLLTCRDDLKERIHSEPAVVAWTDPLSEEAFNSLPSSYIQELTWSLPYPPEQRCESQTLQKQGSYRKVRPMRPDLQLCCWLAASEAADDDPPLGGLMIFYERRETGCRAPTERQGEMTK